MPFVTEALREGWLMAKRPFTKPAGPDVRDVARMLRDVHDHIVAIEDRLAAIETQGRKGATAHSRLLTLATDIATELEALQIEAGGLSSEDFGEVTAAFASAIKRLKGVADDPSNPDPA